MCAPIYLLFIHRKKEKVPNRIYVFQMVAFRLCFTAFLALYKKNQSYFFKYYYDYYLFELVVREMKMKEEYEPRRCYPMKSGSMGHVSCWGIGLMNKDDYIKIRKKG